jgi:diguanylate cyclase (GGDEF)-like protein/PAS domain S-box-containing protein
MADGRGLRARSTGDVVVDTVTTRARPSRLGRRRPSSTFTRLLGLLLAVALAGPLAELATHGTDVAMWGRWTNLAVLVIVATAAGLCVARFRRDRRIAVGLIAAGITTWAIGQVVWFLSVDVFESMLWPGPSDVWYLMFPVFVLAGLVARTRDYVPVSRLTVYSDAALMSTAIWFLAWDLAISDGLAELGLSRPEQFVVAAYSFGGIAITCLALVMTIRQPTPTIVAVFVGALSISIADTVAAVQWGGTRSWWYLLSYAGRAAAFVAFAALACVASRPPERVETRPQLLRLVVVYLPGSASLSWALVGYLVGDEVADPVSIGLAVAYVVMLGANQAVRWFENSAYAGELRSGVERLRRAETELREVLEDIPEALVVIDSSGTIVEVNASLVELVQRPAAEIVGAPYTTLLCSEHHDVAIGMFTTLLAGVDQESPILRIDAGSDDAVFVEAAARMPVRDHDRIVVTLRDVTERILREDALERAQDRFRSAFHNAPIGMVLVTVDVGLILDVNEALERMLGHRRDEVLGRRVHEFIHQDDRGAHAQHARHGPHGVTFVDEQRFVRADGEVMWARTSVSVLEDAEHGRVAIAHVIDITEQRSAAIQLEWAATHDELTGLPNRTHFMTELRRRVDESPTGAVAVLFIDLDNFKVINDSLGHAMGDHLLRAMASRLRTALRDGDLLGRFGGDEFMVLLEGSVDDDVARATAERLRREIAQPLVIDDTELFVTGSIGIALADARTSSASDLLRDADAAMYRAKARGRDFVEVFAPAVHDASVLALRTSNELRRALERGEIVPYYQPIVELSTGVLTGFEVLARWRHPERGLLGADQFLPLAEETGLITEVGATILRASLVQLGRWRDRSPDFSELTIAVNVSGRQLLSGDFTDVVSDALAEAGVPAGSLWLEITETALMTDVKAATVALRELRSLGLHLSVDDFGTGYSSLTYLKRFPVEAIKVDRSFVNGLGIDVEDSTIVEAVVNLGHSLGLRVVAEGVETPLQLSRLRELGCDGAQGYLFGRPRPAEIIEAERTMA